MGLCLLWQPAILLYIIVILSYVVLVWRNTFSSSSSSSVTSGDNVLRPVEECAFAQLPTRTSIRLSCEYSRIFLHFSC